MLRNTFCHLPGIGPPTERKLWDAGVHSWDCLEHGASSLPPKRIDRLKSLLINSRKELDNGNPNYFSENLSSDQHWRLFADFRDSVAYLDIETTGLDRSINYITTMVIYDAEGIQHYVRGKNLDDFKENIKKYKLLVTYNGKTFDIPFIESKLGITLDQAHIDLRYVLKSLGYSGGLKYCEKQLGFDRGNLSDVDGFMAVMLWYEYKNSSKENVLDTLLAYNVEDVLTLENLMVFAFNEKLRQTPFFPKHEVPDPIQPPNPFDADLEIIDNLRGKSFFGVY